jgi:signal transduction histidine kinase
MVQQLTIAYECINSIGNSLELEEMLEDIISTFVRRTGAIGGKYIGPDPLDSQHQVHIGRDFEIPLQLTQDIEAFEIHSVGHSLKILDIFIHDGNFLFAFKEQNNLVLLGNMFVNFRTKITNAIEACYNVEQLKKLNKNLKAEISQEKDKNAFNEKLMISQSRMAIMGEMIGMIAHQWRQPITVIGMITNNMILDLHLESFEGKRAIKELETVDKQVHYLSRTIDDFRNFFKPNRLAQYVSFSQIRDELILILGKSFESYNIHLSFEGAMDVKIKTFKNELLQVFLNILANAKDAFSGKNIQGAHVRVKMEAFDQNLKFFIEDNAGGIETTIINKIFEPYFSTKDEKNGTGLGLYMSAMIVEKHLGGNIMVCPKDDGTLFQITIKSVEEQNDVY